MTYTPDYLADVIEYARKRPDGPYVDIDAANARIAELEAALALKHERHRPIPATIRMAVIRRDEGKCRYCGKAGEMTVVPGLTDRLPATVRFDMAGFALDHVVPLSRGGKTEASNLVLCCKPCNSSKGTRTLDEWNLHKEAI